MDDVSDVESVFQWGDAPYEEQNASETWGDVEMASGRVGGLADTPGLDRGGQQSKRRAA